MIAPAYTDGAITLYEGDCIDVMRELEAESIDAIVTDPPYGLVEPRSLVGFGTAQRNGGRSDEDKILRRGGFMGKAWDGTGVAFDVATWEAALRVLKPGGFLLAFGGTRTFHRLTCGIEDAGFEIRDCLSWLYGSGFPKSLDVSKAIDKAAGAEREVESSYQRSGRSAGIMGAETTITRAITAPAPDAAREWAGWGTALKPAWEPCIVARKPIRGTVAANVIAYGTGALNIDAGRIESPDADLSRVQRQQAEGSGVAVGKGYVGAILGKEIPTYKPGGRWPANVALGCACETEHDPGCAVAMLDAQSGERQAGAHPAMRGAGSDGYHGWPNGTAGGERIDTGTGGASRFFYTAKASRSEREAWGRIAGDVDPQRRSDGRESDIENPRLRTSDRVNDHPTVKPIELMAWLLRLVTPPGGLVLDPFAGSGTTLVAARRERIRCIGIERDERSVQIAAARIAAQWEVKLGL